MATKRGSSVGNNHDVGKNGQNGYRVKPRTDEVEALKAQVRRMQELFAEFTARGDRRENGSGAMQHFSDSIAVIGLKEALTWEHRPLKAVWILLILLGFAGTIVYIYHNTNDYLNAETATKITLGKSVSYEYPPFVLCPPWWFNIQTLRSMGLSRNAFKYSLGFGSYLQTYYSLSIDRIFKDLSPNDEYSNDTAMSIGITNGRRAFREFYRKRNFSNIIDYFKTIASNMTGLNDSCAIDRCPEADLFVETCSKCQEPTPTEKIVFRNAICYIFRLSNVTQKSQDDWPTSIHLYNNYNTGGLLFETTKTWLMDFLPNIGADEPNTELKAFSSVTLKVSPQRIISLPNASNCVDTSIKRTYDQRVCTEKCLSKLENSFYKGTPYEGHRYFEATNDTNQLFNFFDGYQAGSVDSQSGTTDNQTIDLAQEQILTCYTTCRSPCDRTMYDIVIERNRNDGGDDDNSSVIDIYFKNTALYRGGIVTWQEVSTTSFSEFVSNVGGTLGLFLGCTLMTLAQVVLSVLNYSMNQRAPKGRKCDPTGQQQCV